MNVQDKIIDFFVTYGFQLVGAVLILVAGVLVANWIGRLAQAWLGRIHVEPPVRLLLTRVIKPPQLRVHSTTGPLSGCRIRHRH